MANTSITIYPQYDSNQVTQINCGTSSPRLGGTIDLSAFPSLTGFRCVLNNLASIFGYTDNVNLKEIRFSSNLIQQQLPSLSALVNLENFQCQSNLHFGPIPSLNGLTKLKIFYCHINRLVSTLPNLDDLVDLEQFFCDSNTDINGSIPNLSNNTKLVSCRFAGNKLTGFAGSAVSNTLGSFTAQNNQLNQSSVNAILSSFVAANKTTGTRILNVGGTGNAAPTGQGIIDKEILISRDWTITTNQQYEYNQ